MVKMVKTKQNKKDFNKGLEDTVEEISKKKKTRRQEKWEIEKRKIRKLDNQPMRSNIHKNNS